MTGALLPVRVLAARVIANLSPELARQLGLPEHCRSAAVLSADCDDVLYIALDEATKAACVTVGLARSLYAGAANATTALAGEVIGVLGGPNPSEVKSGLAAALRAAEGGLGFRSANADDSVCYLAHCIGSCGSYLSAQAGVRPGAALAYLVAPPVEAVWALDRALKAADVTLRQFFTPPSETNFSGGLLSGTQSACRAACEAFAQAVCEIAAAPRQEE